MNMTETLVYLSIVTIICFAVILALYLLHKKFANANEINLKTKAEK